jgi:ABC-type amino acid transport substrate-binding protein
MTSRLRAACLAFVMACAALASHQAARGQEGDEVIVAIPNNVFANLRNGQPTGVILEVVDLVLRTMGRNPTYLVTASSIVREALSSGVVGMAAVAIAPATPDPKRRFSRPIITEQNIIAVRAGDNPAVTKISDLYGRTLGGRVGFVYPLLEHDPKIKLRRYSGDGDLMRSLILHETDVAIVSAVSDTYRFRAESVIDKISLGTVSLGAVPLRAEFSPQRFSAADLATFDADLDAVMSGPQWKAILDHNGMADLVHDWKMIQ